MSWKFHDYNMLINALVKTDAGIRMRPIVYSLTGLAKGSSCLIFNDSGDNSEGWTRKTCNEGSTGSIRYASYPDLDSALQAGIAWARRKDEELAQCM